MLVVASEVMRDLLRRAERVAATDEPVLLLGETGTGKDLLARWIHDHSPRAGRPFLPLNCTALPESLIESELFGYRRGAFTDARADKGGLFEAVRGGTVFLDEVGDLPLAVQVKLLRVLETHEVLPLGAREPVRVDFRLVAATNKDLTAARQAGTFRDDLFYRIGVFVLSVPPLRERLEEVPVLALHFAREVRPEAEIAPEALERLLCYPWPGNVRELRNAVRHAALLADEPIIRLHHFPEWIQQGCEFPEVLASGSLREKVQCFERHLLEHYLKTTGGNVQEALKRLGIARSSFYRKLRRSARPVRSRSS
jgi:DNA-binding NtrC family response regulator